MALFRAFKWDSREFHLLVWITLSSYAAILLSPQILFDDSVRVATNRFIDEGVHGRFSADFLLRLLECGISQDSSPFAQIVFVILICLAAMVILHLFLPDTRDKSSFLSVLPFVVSPYTLSLIVFRYDAFSMGLAIFLAVVPFLFFAGSPVVFIGLASLCLFVSLSLYQVAYGMYAAMCCLVLLRCLVREPNCNAIVKKGMLLFCPLLCSVIAYYPCYLATRHMALANQTLYPETLRYVLYHSALPALSDIPAVLLQNSLHFFAAVYHGWTVCLPTVLFMLLVLLFLISYSLQARFFFAAGNFSFSEKLVRVVLACLLMLFLPLASYGLQLFMAHNTLTLRTFSSLAVVFGGLSVVTCSFLYPETVFNREKTPTQGGRASIGAPCPRVSPFEEKRFRAVRRGFLLVCCLYGLWAAFFCNGFGTALRDQYRADQAFLGILLEDLDVLSVTRHISNIASNKKDFPVSPHLDPFLARYPLLKDIPTTTSLFSWILYVPSQLLGLKPLYPAEPSPETIAKGKTLVERKRYSILQINEDTVYVRIF